MRNQPNKSPADPVRFTFQLSATRSLSTGLAGTAINTSGSQSGTHSVYFCPHGLGDGSTTFNVPDMRGRVPVGLDNIGGTDAARLSVANAFGFASGEENHPLTVAEMPDHAHDFVGGWGAGANFRPQLATNLADYGLAGLIYNSGGSGAVHNNMQPYVLMNWIIRT